MNQPMRQDPFSLARPAPRDSLVDVLDRVLDKGVVIAGDIAISLLDIELLTIKLRLLIASVDKAREMGIDWWQREAHLTSTAQRAKELRQRDDMRELKQENMDLRRELAHLRSRMNKFLDQEDAAEPHREKGA